VHLVPIHKLDGVVDGKVAVVASTGTSPVVGGESTGTVQAEDVEDRTPPGTLGGGFVG
jgi:hypothetical protein